MDQKYKQNYDLYKFLYYFGIFLVLIASGILGGFLYAYIYKKPVIKTVYLPQYLESIRSTDGNSYDNLYTYYSEDINKNISSNGEFSVVLYNNRGISFQVFNSSGINVTSSSDQDQAINTRGTTPEYTAIKVPFTATSTSYLTLKYNTGFHDIKVLRIDFILPDDY